MSCPAGILVLLGFSSLSVAAQQVSFEFSYNAYCPPALITFTNTSANAEGDLFIWDFGKGGKIISGSKVLQEVYTQPGEYAVTLSRVVGADTSSVTKSLVIYEGPVADFSADTLSGCPPLHVNFSDQSSAGDATITEYFWDLQNGFTNQENSTDFSYTQPGQHSVYLRVIDENGCSSYAFKEKLIRVWPLPKADFSSNDRFSCSAPLNVSFLNLSSGDQPMSYSWDFGDGISSVTFNGSNLYTDIGSFDVTLNVTNRYGCSVSELKESYIQIGADPGEIFVSAEGNNLFGDSLILCPGIYQFRTTRPAQENFLWEVTWEGSVIHSDSSSLDAELSAPGQVDISLVLNTEGQCPDTLRRTYFVAGIDADFTVSDSLGCQLPFQVDLEAQTLNADTLWWIFPDGSHGFGSQVSYTIPYFSNHGVEYSHQETRETYPFRLVIVDGNGCADSLDREVIIDRPVARLMPDTTFGCVPLEIQFEDSSRSSSPIVQYEYFLDSVSQGFYTPGYTHSLNDPGKYSFQVAITNAAGCSDTSYSVMIRTGDATTASVGFLPDPVCAQDTLQLFRDGPDSMDWQVAVEGLYNSGKLHAKDTTIIFGNAPAPGDYPVRGTFKSNGCLTEIPPGQTLTVSGPTGDFKYEFSCDSALNYRFFSDIADADSWWLEVGDSVYVNPDSIDVKFPGSGDYTITLRAENGSTGCQFVKSKTIPVRQINAVIDIKPVLCLNTEETFSAGGSADVLTHCYQEGYYWNFDDGSPPRRSYAPGYQYGYSQTGTFEPLLVVTAANGCTDTARTVVEVREPLADFTAEPEEACGPEMTVRFNYDPVDPETDSIYWDFGDGSSDLSNNPAVTHSYSGYGELEFIAVLRITDNFGCVGQSARQITVNTPVSSFQPADQFLCLGEEAEFLPQTPGADLYLIDYGDGSPPGPTLTHTYSSPGTYTVTITAQKDSCISTSVCADCITVEDPDAAYTISDTAFYCYPAEAVFSFNGDAGTVAEGTWQFAPGIQSEGFSTPATFTYTEPGTYETSLAIRTLNGCTGSYSKTIVVSGPEPDYSFGPLEICRGDSVLFTLNDAGAYDDFEWIFGDGTTSGLVEVFHPYDAQGYIVPALRVVDGDCEVLVSRDTLYVSELTAEFSFQPDQTGFCASAPINAVSNGADINFSQWFLNGQFVSNNLSLLNLVIDESGSYVLTHAVSNQSGCTDTSSVILDILELPDFSISGDTLVCAGSEAELSVVQPDENWSVQWFPPDFIDNNQSFNPLVAPDTNTVFTAILTDPNGCSSAKNHMVWVQTAPEINRQPTGDTSIYIGESVELAILAASGQLNYQWLPESHISCVNCSNPVVSPLTTTTYTAEVSDACFTMAVDFLVEVIVDFYLEFPTAFSPNGDGENDTFYPEMGKIDHFDFRIFNRWGNLVFQTNSSDAGWDGYYNGKPQNPDTYSYHIRAVTIHGYEFERKGTFVLMR